MTDLLDDRSAWCEVHWTDQNGQRHTDVIELDRVPCVGEWLFMPGEDAWTLRVAHVAWCVQRQPEGGALCAHAIVHLERRHA